MAFNKIIRDVIRWQHRHPRNPFIHPPNSLLLHHWSWRDSITRNSQSTRHHSTTFSFQSRSRDDVPQLLLLLPCSQSIGYWVRDSEIAHTVNNIYKYFISSDATQERRRRKVGMDISSFMANFRPSFTPCPTPLNQESVASLVGQ